MSTFRDTLKFKNVPKQSGPIVDQNFKQGIFSLNPCLLPISFIMVTGLVSLYGIKKLFLNKIGLNT